MYTFFLQSTPCPLPQKLTSSLSSSAHVSLDLVLAEYGNTRYKPREEKPEELFGQEEWKRHVCSSGMYLPSMQCRPSRHPPERPGNGARSQESSLYSGYLDVFGTAESAARERSHPTSPKSQAFDPKDATASPSQDLRGLKRRRCLPLHRACRPQLRRQGRTFLPLFSRQNPRPGLLHLGQRLQCFSSREQVRIG